MFVCVCVGVLRMCAVCHAVYVCVVVGEGVVTKQDRAQVRVQLETHKQGWVQKAVPGFVGPSTIPRSSGQVSPSRSKPFEANTALPPPIFSEAAVKLAAVTRQ